MKILDKLYKMYILKIVLEKKKVLKNKQTKKINTKQTKKKKNPTPKAQISAPEM